MTANTKEIYNFHNSPELRKLVALANYEEPMMPKQGERPHGDTVAVLVFIRSNDVTAFLTYRTTDETKYQYVKPEEPWREVPDDTEVVVGVQLNQKFVDAILEQKIEALRMTVTGHYIEMDALKAPDADIESKRFGCDLQLGLWNPSQYR